MSRYFSRKNGRKRDSTLRKEDASWGTRPLPKRRFYSFQNRLGVQLNDAETSLAVILRTGGKEQLIGSAVHRRTLSEVESPQLVNHDFAAMAYFKSCVTEIGIDYVNLQTPQGAVRVENDFVFALTGYHPDYDFLQSLGIELSKEQCRPVCDPETLESNVPGIYVAGVIVAGAMTSEIFIENGRFHGKLIAADLRQKLSSKS